MSNKPKTIDLEVLTVGRVPPPGALATVADRAGRVLDYHNACKRTAAQQVIYAFLAGYELLQAKLECGHGHFLKWCDRFADHDITHRTLTNYMSFADRLQPKLETVSNFDYSRLQLTNGELPAQEKEIILTAIHEVTNGSTLTDLYRELGIIRQPQRPGYTAPRDLTPDEQAEAEETQAEEYLRQVHADVDRIDLKLLGRAPTHVAKQIRELFIEKSKLIASLSKGKGKAPKGKTKAARTTYNQ